VARKKPEKYYTVRVVNPSRPGPARSIALPGRETSSKTKNPSSCHVCTKSNPRERNASIDSYERSVLQALAEDAERTEDDWGISAAVYDYLDHPEAYDDTPLQYLNLVARDVWYHYQHVGDEDDPMLSKASAKRAEKLVSAAMRDLRKYKGIPNPCGRTKNQETRGETMCAWIKERLAEGFTVYIQTPLLTMPIKPKHADLVRLHDGHCQVRRGKRWDIIDWVRVSARRDKNPRRSGKPKTRRTGSYTVTTTKHAEELEVRIMPTMAYASGEPVELWIPLDDERDVEMAQRGGDRDIELLLAQAHYDEYGNARNPRGANPLSKAAGQLHRRLQRSRDEGVRYYTYKKVPQAAYELEDAGLVRLSPYYNRETKVELVASNPRRRNPSFRYAAVPVDDAGHETVYVARGHRRADMLTTVARAVPGDPYVDLQHTRTFATKHEATKYAKTMSPRVVALSRRMKNP
jgi:hypothetical protein